LVIAISYNGRDRNTLFLFIFLPSKLLVLSHAKLQISRIMKGALVLLALVAVSACQDEEPSVFDKMGDFFLIRKDEFDLEMDNNVLNASTVSGFTEHVDNVLAYAERQLCFDTVGECDSTDSMILGCNCVNAFKETGECADVPCRLISIAKNAAPVLQQLVEESSGEGLAQIVMDNLYIPVTNILCACPGTFSATATCARDYDGDAFIMMENGTEKEAVYREVIRSLDLGTIREVVHTIFTASCGEIDGVNCYQRHAAGIVEMVAMLENSVNPDYDPSACDSLKRHQTAFEDYLDALDYGGYEGYEGLKKYVNRLINAYVDMEHAYICDANCAEYVAEEFYGCCAKNAMEVYSSDRMQRKVMKIIKNVYEILLDVPPGDIREKFPNFNKAAKKYYSIFDFEKFCGPDIAIYKEVNAMCNAILA